jgi:ABC-type Fe3+-siderophore transport system permease subunit
MSEVNTEELDPMEALVRQADADRDQARQERDEAIAARDFARKQSADIAKRLRCEREIYDKTLRRLNGKIIQDIRFPFILLMAFAGLALIVGLLVKGEMLSLLVGEPLSYGCICVCAFFGGIVWARTESRVKHNVKS